MDSLEVTRWITYLAMPLTVGIGLVLLGVLIDWAKSTRVGYFMMLLGMAVLWVFSMPTMATALAHSLEVRYPPTPPAQCRHADAIVILGGAIRRPMAHDPTPRLEDDSDRLWQAARLYEAHCARVVFVAGGGDVKPPALTKEAPAIVEFLKEYKVPSSAILYEDRSRTTVENARETWKMLDPRGARNVLLVTSAWHMRRAAREFERVGFKVIPAPGDYRSFDRTPGARAWLPDAKALALSHLAVKEWLGWWYRSLASG